MLVYVLVYIFSVTKVTFSEQGSGMWNKLQILNLANKSVHTLFCFWEICCEVLRKSKREMWPLRGCHRFWKITPQTSFLRLSCCCHLLPAILYIYVRLFEFWSSVIQVFQMQTKGIAFGGVP